MPRKRNDGALSSGGSDRAGPAPAVSGPSSVPSVSGLSPEQGRSETALEALRDLYARDDGWLRIVPHGQGKTVYYKWKFTRGKWANHYVMYRDDDNRPFTSILSLESKVNDVDVGARRPALDSYYES